MYQSYDEEREAALYCESLSYGQLATESCREYARNVGRDNPDVAWISTPFDTWERNPFYTGPEPRHPEEDDYEDCEPRDPLHDAHVSALVDSWFLSDDDLPF